VEETSDEINRDDRREAVDSLRVDPQGDAPSYSVVAARRGQQTKVVIGMCNCASLAEKFRPRRSGGKGCQIDCEYAKRLLSASQFDGEPVPDMTRRQAAHLA
jgi:hypothetical protein